MGRGGRRSGCIHRKLLPPIHRSGDHVNSPPTWAQGIGYALVSTPTILYLRGIGSRTGQRDGVAASSSAQSHSGIRMGEWMRRTGSGGIPPRYITYLLSQGNGINGNANVYISVVEGTPDFNGVVAGDVYPHDIPEEEEVEIPLHSQNRMNRIIRRDCSQSHFMPVVKVYSHEGTDSHPRWDGQCHQHLPGVVQGVVTHTCGSTRSASFTHSNPLPHSPLCPIIWMSTLYDEPLRYPRTRTK